MRSNDRVGIESSSNVLDYFMIVDILRSKGIMSFVTYQRAETIDLNSLHGVLCIIKLYALVFLKARQNLLMTLRWQKNSKIKTVKLKMSEIIGVIAETLKVIQCSVLADTAAEYILRTTSFESPIKALIF